MFAPVFQHSGIALEDGRVLVAGGITGLVANNNVIIHAVVGPIQIYDPSTEEWTVLEPIEGPGAFYSLVELADNRVLMVGVRVHEDGEFVPMAALFDANSDSWVAAPPPSALRALPNLLLLQDGRVFMTAGLAVTPDDIAYFSNPDKLNSSEIFDPSTGTWTRAASTQETMEEQNLFLLEDGRVLAIGTVLLDYDSTVLHAEVYDPDSDQWSALESIDPYFVYLDGVELADERLLVTGDYIAIDNATPVERSPGVDTLRLPDGTHLVIEYDDTEILSVQLPDGARISEADFKARFFGAKVFDPSTDLWVPAGLMVHPRASATLSLLPDGRVLAAGGARVELPWESSDIQTSSTEEQTFVSFTEIFDPATGLWSLGPELSKPRVNHSATVLSDGRVLIAGGIGVTRTQNPEIYPLAEFEIIDVRE